MKNRVLILVFTLLVTAVSLNAEVDPLSIGVKEVPSETYLSKNKQSVGASLDVQTISSPTRGVVRVSDAVHNTMGWGDPSLPGGDGWIINDQTGNVGYPVGDVSFPILLSMLLLYFLYRGVSSSKRKSSF